MKKLLHKIKPVHSLDDKPFSPKLTKELKKFTSYARKLHANYKLRGESNSNAGFIALFTGASGTGKTMAAEVIANELQMDLYRIDLSKVVSKYIGETEKNLKKILKEAENKNWILFFDEADALFGKRSNVKSAHDKYANHEVTYLLQRVEDYTGLIILASNYKSNINQSFLRRFNAIIHFPLPNQSERYAIWNMVIPPKRKS